MKEQGPRPAPEQPDRIEQLDRKVQAADRFLHKRETLLHRYGLSDLADQAQAAHDSLLQTIRTELKTEASEFVVFEAPKPTKKSREALRLQRAVKKVIDSGKIGEVLARKEKPKKKRPEKSRGLKDARPVEFTLRSGKKLRGKEGKGVKLLGREKNNRRSKTHELDRDQLAAELYPGVSIDKARKMVNKTMRSARKHLLAGSRLDLITRRDYKNGTTYYSLVDRKPRKKR